MNSINDIKNELKEYKVDSLAEFISKYSSDERSGVKALVKKAEKQIQDYEKELERIKKLSFYENKYSDYNFICGIDEVGRGPLAGPVVAGAVILPKDCDILYIND